MPGATAQSGPGGGHKSWRTKAAAGTQHPKPLPAKLTCTASDPRCQWGILPSQLTQGELLPKPLWEPPALTKPLPMMRQSPLSESQSRLVKWNCASCELRNRGPSVVWGQQGGRSVTARGGGKEGPAGPWGRQGCGTRGHYEAGRAVRLTSSCCGMSCMMSFCGHWSVSLREEGSAGPGAPTQPAPNSPTHSQVLPPVHVGLAG